MLTTSPREADRASLREVIAAGDYYLGVVRAGQAVRILDLEGNQAADTLFYCADNPLERYSGLSAQ